MLNTFFQRGLSLLDLPERGEPLLATEAVLNPILIAAVGQTTGSDDGLEGPSAARPLASEHPKDIRSDRKG